ncbi:nuclear transport factor 2 family protein [Rhizobium sp. RU36D]|uniref:nuclear transport factor 2 family protein n=1 Tax=Rhizobium sp. RU36D TaxID=1907415 RepID=UPI0009D8A8DE|nr:nuclear transport factor 2 family protein [Rhizobium sp. RU36D]SMC67389.1 SnoaL-like domain-containing protein [Rhizobium sp. RU36D]
MSFDPAVRLQQFHDAINRLDYAAIESCFASDVLYLSGGTGNVAGRDAVMAAFRRYFETYPDQVASNDKVERLSDRQARSFWRLRATHAVTGEALIRQGIETITFDEQGAITEVRVEDL